jgi:hypothetical protein
MEKEWAEPLQTPPVRMGDFGSVDLHDLRRKEALFAAPG